MASRLRIRAPIVFLMAALLGLMGLGDRFPRTPPHEPSVDPRLQDARFAPTWRVTLRCEYLQATRMQAQIRSARTVGACRRHRRMFLLHATDYNRMAAEAPPEVWRRLAQPRAIVLSSADKAEAQEDDP